ncbi:hypothetical protein EDB19DRAFT_1914575 [Suillus lakei]|nr:hypothetical protein EDB19DRAFT_1914575 [Suillus lakei]
MAYFALSFGSVMSGSKGIPSLPPSCALAPIITTINLILPVSTVQTITELFLRVLLPHWLNVLPVLCLHEAVPIS